MDEIIKAKDLPQLKIAELLTITIQSAGYKIVGKGNPPEQINGMTIFEEDAAALVVMLDKDLKTDYRFLDFQEIERAFHNGVRKRYGKFYGINISTLCSWIDSYLESDERQDYLNSKRQYISAARQIEQNTEPTEEEKERICKDGINKAYKQFIKKLENGKENSNGFKTLVSFMPVVADYGGCRRSRLVSEGLMQPTEKLEDFFKRCYEKGIKKIY